MSCSKPLPPFVFDSLYYLNRDKLERFSIVCRQLKNIINRYLHTKPYRIFDELSILGGLYSLRHNNVRWHPNQDNYCVQQFLAGRKRSTKCLWDDFDDEHYSFAEMHPYLSPTIRIKLTTIYEAEDRIYNLEHIEQMESIVYLWRSQEISIKSATGSRIGVNNFLPILNSPTILQCQTLYMHNAHFSFKDYSVLYSVKVIEVVYYYDEREIDLWQYWQQFFEQPGVKPVVAFYCFPTVKNLMIDRLFKAFSSAVEPRAFKIVFTQVHKSLTEFRETNKTSGEILELKKGLPAEYKNEDLKKCDNYTLERSSI